MIDNNKKHIVPLAFNLAHSMHLATLQFVVIVHATETTYSKKAKEYAGIVM